MMFYPSVKQKPVRWITLTGIILIAILIISVHLKPTLQHNLDMLYYETLLFTAIGSSNHSPSEIADRINENPNEAIRPYVECRVEVLRQYADDASPDQKWLHTDKDTCLSITPIGNQAVVLPITTYASNLPVTLRSNDQLEFRRDSSIWGPIFVRQAGEYRFDIEAYAIGPAPARLRLWVADQSRILDFTENAEIQSLYATLSPGIHWVELSYINDGSLDGIDRNLRLISIEMIPYGD